MAAFTTSAGQARKAFFKRFRWYSIIGITLLLAVLITGGVVRSPIFKINTIEVVGVPSDVQSEILRDVKITMLHMRLFAVLGSENYFSWPTDFPYAAAAATSLHMEKSFWNKKITLSADPRQRYAVWCTDTTSGSETCSWIDQLGVAFANAPVTEGQLVRTIYTGDIAQRPAEGTPVASTDIFSVIKKIIDGIAPLEINVIKTTYDASTQELRIQTDSGTLIRFSTRLDPNPTALPALRRLMEKPGLDKLEYLNLTVENRSFLKYK